jgi:Fe-S-cluster containining protein
MMNKVIRDFECAMCGRCCAHQDLVGLSAYELYGLASYMKMEPAAFFDKYCVLTATSLDPGRRLYVRTEDGACPFLKDDRCVVYEARPYACEAYPMRVYWSIAGDMKAFVRSRYPMLVDACSLFKLEDSDVLLGDYELLARQAIARWADDAYFSMAGDVLDLSIPYRVADHFIHDKELMNIAKRYVVDPDHPPSGRDAGLACAKISLTLQAAMWNVTSAFVSVDGQAVYEDERIGKYFLLSTDIESVKALRMLVESGRLDLARTFAVPSNGGHIVASVHGSSSDHVALGFLFEADNAALEELTDNGNKPLHVFFMAEGAADGKLTGFSLNIKI